MHRNDVRDTVAASLETRVPCRIREILGARRMTGAELSRRLPDDWTVWRVNRRLTGAVPLTLAELDVIAAALEVPVTDLVQIPAPREPG